MADPLIPPPFVPADQTRGLAPFAAKLAIGLALLAVFVVGLAIVFRQMIHQAVAPDPVSIAASSLTGLREQNRISAFEARYVSVVTSTQTRLGFEARRTLIMPGMVRYEVDLGQLQQRDVRWDAQHHMLTVTLPPVQVDSPQVDLNAIRSYDAGGVLVHLTDAASELDAANRRAGQADLIAQASQPAMVRMARDATRRAVEHSFALPLRAAGLQADVTVRFQDEPVPNDERWDTSRSLDEVLGNRP